MKKWFRRLRWIIGALALIVLLLLFIPLPVDKSKVDPLLLNVLTTPAECIIYPFQDGGTLAVVITSSTGEYGACFVGGDSVKKYRVKGMLLRTMHPYGNPGMTSSAFPHTTRKLLLLIENESGFGALNQALNEENHQRELRNEFKWRLRIERLKQLF
jgi:hypothetical protein